ncbi:MAG: TMEM165/GDT1 family protein [Dermatophilaceae bacterium]
MPTRPGLRPDGILCLVLDLSTIAVVFGLIFLVELPDKTFIATLVMATRFRPLLVWIGVAAAFFVQTLVAVAIGGVLTKLPKTPIEVFATLMFLIGGILLLRGAGQADAEEAETEEEFAAKASRQAKGWHVVTMCFGILFLAEWGDLSQILTASLVLKYHDPVSVFLGAFLALATVSGLGAVLGRALLKRMRLSTLRRAGGVVCLLLAALSVLQLTGVIGG